MTSIFYENFPVARLTFTDQWRLDYDPTWEARRSAFPISLTMPLRSGTIDADRLLPWLANLLPETHLAEIGQRLKVSPQDIVGLLGHIGRDTAGALSIGEPRKSGIHLQPVPDEAALERILNELPAKPFLVGERGVSMSLAGVQEKLPVFVDEAGKTSIPVDGTPSTHILKPDTDRLPDASKTRLSVWRLRGPAGWTRPRLQSARLAVAAICLSNVTIASRMETEKSVDSIRKTSASSPHASRPRSMSVPPTAAA